ncbi:2-oxoglutarate dehydrogenase complex dihydrolipoyllysine-residue succinyltransferase [bacterium]|nr:2-oxoglutarate dehydrogenase complex dihydrolipoyllysine-residue succinyltransferase [bacterium]
MSLEVKIPNVGESVTEVTLAQWLVEDGDFVEMDQPICELETDKASQELFAEAAGKISLIASEGDDLGIGAVLASIDTDAKGESKTESKDTDKTEKASKTDGEKAQSAETHSTNADQSSFASGHPSPAAEKVLAEKGIETNQVKGTGVAGRITKADAMAASKPVVKTPVTESMEHRVEEGHRAEQRTKMSRLRQTIAKKLVEVKNTTAMLTTFNEIDMGNVMDLRKKYKELFKEKHDVGLGFMSFFTKAVTLALQEFPSVNGKIAGDEIITYNYCDIGIAVSTDRGLVVPVIRDAQTMNLAQIEKAVMNYALKARDNKISIEDMQGGTFSLTNGGVFGSMMSTPIINGDQSAILGMHNIVQRPMVVNGEIKIRPVMYVALSYDHRIIDGKESVSFLYRVKELIEDPARLLLEV